MRCQPLFSPIEKELFYIEFTFPLWSAPPIRIGGSVSFTASFGVSLGGRACLADRKVEMVLTPEASLSVRALATTSANGRVWCEVTCGDATRVQVAASVFLDLIVVRGGIEMDIKLVTIGVQPVGIVSLKDGASRTWI